MEGIENDHSSVPGQDGEFKYKANDGPDACDTDEGSSGLNHALEFVL